ncbi:hypothetical protein PM082_005791 [Marasmius tenuissimus]|nr:hypothetical protein PM082_005791 [Marasmius tenuissimus]
MPKFPPSTQAVDWQSLPFSSEGISESTTRTRDKSALNFTRLNVRRWVRESVWPRKRFKNDLRKMLELPEELIMEILSHTHPIDLHAFRVVNRSFRAFLSSPASNAVWKKSFRNCSQPDSPGSTAIPECPEDMNGWEWASLLFGAPVCEYCGDKTPFVWPDPSPVIRKRLCMACFDARTTRIFHHTPFDIVQRLSVVDGLVLKTVFQHSIPQGDYIPNWLINSDFETVLAEYTRLRENGDDTELERYREGRRRYVDTHMKHVNECNRWLIEMNHRFYNELQTKFHDRLRRIMKHLRHEGFAEIDILTSRRGRSWTRLEYLLDEECFSDPYHGGGTFNQRVIRWSTLTRANWRKIREPYCAFTQQFAQIRLQKEREELARQIIDDYRRGETSNVHDASEQPRPPSQSPPAHALAIDFASAYDLEDPSLSKLGEAFEQKKTLVRSVLGLQLSYTVWSARNQVLRLLNAPSLGVDPLELAVSLFVRRTYQNPTDPEDGATPPLYRLTGWEAIASSLDLSLQPFQEGDRHPGAFETIFSPVDPIPAMRQIAFRTIRALLHVLGLNPCTTLAKDMDDRDDRFVCLSCGGPDSGSRLPGKEGLPSSGRKRDRREAHNWREAVVHQLSNNDHDLHPVLCQWKVLPQRLTSLVKIREVDPNGMYSNFIWSCAHCLAHLNSRTSRYLVKRHIYFEHGIHPSQEGVDFVGCFPSVQSAGLPRKLHRLRDGDALYVCLHTDCATRRRLMTEKAVKMHLRSKHGVVQSEAERDFGCVWEGIH